MKRAWPLVRLGDVLLRHKDSLDIEDDEGYTRLTIRMNGQGVGIRDKVCGREIGTKRQFRVKVGQFLLSKIDARNGAFGLVPNDCDNAIVTGNFWAFDISTDRVVPRFIDLLTKTTLFVDYSIKASSGTTNRLYLQEEKFAEQKIELPPIEEQKKIVARIDTVQQQMQAVDMLRSLIDRDIASLLAVRFKETLAQAKWLPMNDVAPIVRREIKINPESNYSELGVRSFFKGAFIRRIVSGTEFTWQKLYQVNANDLIFSNIMAWEKGIALACFEHDKCVGNHRMLTCEAKPEKALAAYLHYYFTTDEGFAKVYAASPGTAARNRTLTADSLMGLEVPIPTLAVQSQFVELKNHIDKIGSAWEIHAETRRAILPSVLNRLLG